MADFTGILGTRNAQAGTLVPGKGPAGISLNTVITVTGQVDFVVQQGKWKRLTETVIVTPTIVRTSIVNKSVTDTVTITPTVVGLPQPYARITQDVVEVIYVSPGNARITQDVLEVVYRKANSQTVTHSITVTPALLRKGDNTQSVTSTVVVTPTIFARDDHIRLTVSQGVSVSHALIKTGVNNQFLGHTVNVSGSVFVVSDHHQTVNHSITVTPTVSARDAVDHQTITAAIAVTPTILQTTNRVPASEQHDIAVNQTVDFIIISHAPRNVFMTVLQHISVSQTCAGRNTVNRQNVTTSIGVSDTETERDLSNHLFTTINITGNIVLIVAGNYGRVSSTILVTQSISARNTRIRLSVISNISVNTSASAQQLNISLTQNVHVAPTLTTIHSLVPLTLTQPITVTPTTRFSPNIRKITDNISIIINSNGAPNHLRMGIFNQLFVTDSITAQTNHETITHNISVATLAKTNRYFQSVQHTILVSQSGTQGASIRVLSITDNISVTPTIYNWKTPNRQSVTSSILVDQNVFEKGPITIASVADYIGINTLAQAQILRPPHFVDNIHVTPTVTAYCVSNRQSITQNITITPALRSSPKRVSLTDTILVIPRSSVFEWHVRHNITVTQKFGRIIEKNLTDNITVTPALSRKVISNKHVTDTLPMTEILTRRAIWYRPITQVLVIPDDNYLKQYSFWPFPITLSSATGTRVTKEVKLSSKLAEIKLPAALLGNSTGNVDEVIVQRSMNSRTLVIIKSSDRQRLKLQFRVKTAKSYEMMIFVKQNMSELITLTNWDGQIWIGRFTSNPFEMTNAGRWATVREFVTFEIEFEGTKTSG